MKARIMIDGASLSPDDLRVARQAFDGTWEKLQRHYPAGAPDLMRERLAERVLSLIPDTKDPGEIEAIVVQEMTKG
jgi:hypothetical protein